MPQSVLVPEVGELFFPDDASPEEMKRVVDDEVRLFNQEHAGSSIARRAVVDPLIGLAKGIVSVPEGIVGLADIFSRGETGKILESGGVQFKETQNILSGLESPELQANRERIRQTEGFFPKVVETLRRPTTILQTVAESVPSMLGGRAIGQTVLGLSPTIGRFAAGGIGEGTVTAGQMAEQIRQGSPEGTLSPIQALIASGSGAATGLIGVLGGKLADRLGVADVDILTSPNAGSEAKKGILRRIVEGALNEGSEEILQSSQERIAQNIAEGKPWRDGVADNAVSGLFAGMASGGFITGIEPLVLKAPPLPQVQSARAARIPIEPQDKPILVEDIPITPVEELSPAAQEAIRAAQLEGQGKMAEEKVIPQTQPKAAPPPSPPAPAPITPPAGASPVAFDDLQAIAAKVAAGEVLTKQEIQLLDKIIRSVPEVHVEYLRRVAELRGARIAGEPHKLASPGVTPGPASTLDSPPITSPVPPTETPDERAARLRREVLEAERVKAAEQIKKLSAPAKPSATIADMTFSQFVQAAKRGQIGYKIGTPKEIKLSDKSVKELQSKYGKDWELNPLYHEELGRKFGYSTDDIAAFLINRESVTGGSIEVVEPHLRLPFEKAAELAFGRIKKQRFAPAVVTIEPVVAPTTPTAISPTSQALIDSIDFQKGQVVSLTKGADVPETVVTEGKKAGSAERGTRTAPAYVSFVGVDMATLPKVPTGPSKVVPYNEAVAELTDDDRGGRKVVALQSLDGSSVVVGHIQKQRGALKGDAVRDAMVLVKKGKDRIRLSKLLEAGLKVLGAAKRNANSEGFVEIFTAQEWAAIADELAARQRALGNFVEPVAVEEIGETDPQTGELQGAAGVTIGQQPISPIGKLRLSQIQSIVTAIGEPVWTNEEEKDTQIGQGIYDAPYVTGTLEFDSLTGDQLHELIENIKAAYENTRGMAGVAIAREIAKRQGIRIKAGSVEEDAGVAEAGPSEAGEGTERYATPTVGGPTPAGASSEAQVRSEILKFLRLSALPDNIAVISDLAKPYAAVIEGRNQITLNAAQIAPGTTARVLLEEGLHGVWFDPAVQKAWQAVQSSVTPEDIAAERKKRGALDISDAALREEAAISKLTNRSAWKQLWDAIVAAFRRVFGWVVNDSDVLRQAAVNYLRGERVPVQEAIDGPRYAAPTSGGRGQSKSAGKKTTKTAAVPPIINKGGDIGKGPANIPIENDPDYTVFPVDLPEAIRFFNELTGGQFIKVRKKLRALRGAAQGVFRVKGDFAEIELRADLADLLASSEKSDLQQQARDFARATADTPEEEAQIAKRRYEYLLKQAYDEAKRKPPANVLKVLWREIGHWVDWLPDHVLERGNIFGHIAALKNYLKQVIPLNPAKPHGKALTSAERDKMRKEALRQMRAEVGPFQDIIETIMVEEPIFRSIGITPQMIRNLFGISAREDMPDLYRWFAEQSSQVKKEIVRNALRGIVDARAATVGGTEQIGTRRTPKQVRKRSGREPTPQEIEEKFRQLLREEIKRRNLAELEAVKHELFGLIGWWRGEQTHYFSDPSSMFAEAFSVFMNNPAALERRAPIFSALLRNYMDRRAEVSRLYNKIQNEIKSGLAADITEKDMLDKWDKSDERALQEARQQSSWGTKRDFLDNVQYHVDRRFGPIYRPAKGYEREGDLRLAIGNFKYRATAHEAFLSQLNNKVGIPLVTHNLDWKDLGMYMLYRRVISELANKFAPYGLHPKRAQDRLNAMERRIGPKAWRALEKARLNFRKLYVTHVADLMRKARMWTPELQKVIETNVDYATFEVMFDKKDGIAALIESAYGSNTGPHIYRLVGSVKDIKNPATATVLKALSLISATYRNTAKRETVEMLNQMDPLNIQPAKMVWSGKWMEPVIINEGNVGTIVYLEDGKPRAYYVRHVVAESLNSGNAMENILFNGAVKTMANIKAAYTSWSYGFWPVNFTRDTLAWIIQIPGGSPLAWVKQLPRVMAAAKASVKGTPNPDADLALKRLMLISRADPRGAWAQVSNETDLKIASYGMDPAVWSKTAKEVSGVVKFWEHYIAIGKLFERVNKIAAMRHLDERFPNMPEWEKREIVRERGGSPDFLERGASNPGIDLVLMFYNPWKENIRSFVKSARDNPWGFAAKTTAFVFFPTFLQALAASGALGDEWEKMYASMSDYDLTNYLCVPLGWMNRKNGDVMYLRLPLWESARLMHAAAWQALTGRGRGMSQFWGDTLPSVNSLIQLGAQFYQFEIQNKNPYDTYRGHSLLDDKVYRAGGWDAQKAMLKHAWNQTVGGLVGRFRNPQLESPPESDFQKFLGLPGVNPLLGRWIKVSNRGLADADRRLLAPMEKAQGQMQVAVEEIIRKRLDGEALIQSEHDLMRHPAAMEYYGRSMAQIQMSRQSPMWNRLQAAPTAQEKAALLRSMLKE